MKIILSEFLDEVQQIYLAIWDYTHKQKDHPMKCYKTEGLTSIKLKIHCDDLDYLTGADIETCIEIAKSHQKTCFSVWHIETTSTIVEAKHGNMVTILTPMLIINIYQKHEEETE